MNASVALQAVPEESVRFSNQIALSDIHNPTVQRGFDLWNRLCAGRKCPARADMTPRILSDLLRNTVLVRALPDSEDYEIRIVGDAMVQALGASFQGMNTAEIDLILPGFGSLLRTIYRYVHTSGAPLAMRGWYHRKADGRSLFHETVFLPLGNDGQTIDHLLIFAAYAFNADEKLP